MVGPTLDGTTIRFRCNISYAGPSDLSAEARFDVTFQFDGIADPDVPIITVEAGMMALLDETHLQDHFGTKVRSSTMCRKMLSSQFNIELLYMP